MDIAIRHDEAGHRFVAEQGGEVAELTYVEHDAGTVIFDHTYVPAALRGGGVAGTLVSSALDWARAAGRRVVPSCTYVAAYVRRHPEYADLVTG
jgi:predicted GNAT family acetyltransferase